jgi:hypothetical protein
MSDASVNGSSKVIALFHRRVKRIHVQMGNNAEHVRLQFAFTGRA